MIPFQALSHLRHAPSPDQGAGAVAASPGGHGDHAFLGRDGCGCVGGRVNSSWWHGGL